MMRRYEGLFILDIAGKDDAVKTALDRISEEIKGAGGKVESVQKMDHKPFVRPTRKHAAGFYANILFQSPPDALEKLRSRFRLDERIYRVQITHAEEPSSGRKEKRGKS